MHNKLLRLLRGTFLRFFPLLNFKKAKINRKPFKMEEILK